MKSADKEENKGYEKWTLQVLRLFLNMDIIRSLDIMEGTDNFLPYTSTPK